MAGGDFRELKLCGTEFTAGWLLDSLEKNDPVYQKRHGGRPVADVTAEDISGGKGIFSIVLKCIVSFVDARGPDDFYSTVLKVPGTFAIDDLSARESSFKIDDFLLKVTLMHNTEVDFYEVIAHKFPHCLPAVHKTVRMDFPRQGCLHMEDLTPRGCNLDFHHGLSEGQIRSIVGKLAEIHCWLLTEDQSVWRGKFTQQKGVMARIVGMVPKAWSTFFQFSQDQEIVPLMSDERISSIAQNKEFVEYAIHQSYLDFGLPCLLTHGDLWTSNMMFRKLEDGTVSEQLSCILDWQVVHEGNFVWDFVRLLILSCDGEVRRVLEGTIFEFYLNRLNELLTAQGAPPTTFSVTQLKKAYDYLFMAHFAHLIFATPVIFKTRQCGPYDRAERARIDKCLLRIRHVLQDAKALIESGEFDRWLS